MDFVCNAADVKSDLLWHKAAEQAVSRKLYTYADAARLGEAAMRGEYHDVHCWTFTPRSFARLMSAIGAAGLSNLVCRAFSDTPIGGMGSTFRWRSARCRMRCPGRTSNTGLVLTPLPARSGRSFACIRAY
jgi:hypothetical protein